MFGSLLRESAGIVGRRFFLDALLPVFSFGALAVVVVGTARPGGLDQAIQSWATQHAESKALEVTAFFAAVAFLAVLISSTSMVLLRFLEGYWPPPLAKMGKRVHQARLARLSDDEPWLYSRYPPKSRPEEVRPTRFGNVFRSAEIYPALRYGMDGVLFWPRLYTMLPERVATALAETRSTLDRLATLCCLRTVFAVGAGGYLLAVHGSVLVYLACLLGGVLVALTCYLAAVHTATDYAEQIRAAFDVYHRDLAKQLDGEGTDLDRSRWQALGQFWYRGIPRDSEVVPDEPTRSASLTPGKGPVPTLSTWCVIVTVLAAVIGAIWLN